MSAPAIDWPAGGEGQTCLHCAVIDLINKRAAACREAGQTMPTGTTIIVAVVNVVADILAQYKPDVAARMLEEIVERLPIVAQEARDYRALGRAALVRH